MTDGVSYKPMIWSALVFSIVSIGIGIYPLYDKTFANKQDLYKVVRKIANLLFYFIGKVLSGPLLGLAVNIIYCDASDPYHNGNLCYTPEHIFYCILAAILVLLVIYSILGISFVFFSRTPF